MAKKRGNKGFRLKWILRVGIILTFSAYLFLLYLFHDLPDISHITTTKKPSVTIRDTNGIVLASYGDLYGKQLIYSDIPSYLIDAVIATEDRRFFEHYGIDMWGIIRAAFHNYKSGRIVQGGSTITQQLAKITFLNPDRSIKRKLQEVIIAWQLEDKFSKEQILSIYLNRVFLGKGIFGVDAAARYYFGKSAEDLGLFESAILAGLLKAPSRYSPANNPVLAIGRGKQVLLNMVAAGLLDNKTMKGLIPPSFKQRGKARGILQNPYFTDYVLERLPLILGNIDRDLNIYTTLDIKLQRQLESAASNALNRYKKNKPQAAGIVLSEEGEIKAMLGGNNYKESQFNRSTRAKRQPGSVFKLFVYLTALEQGHHLTDLVQDSKIQIKGWAPKNYSRAYVGEVDLQTAFAKSINTVAVSLSESLGRAKVTEMAHRLGMIGNIPDTPSIALGSAETSLLEITQAYSCIAHDGVLIPAHAILKITDANNNVIYRHNSKVAERVLSIDTNNAMKRLLNASVEQGTARRAKLPEHTTYGKTGTSQNHRDAWFIGFSGNLTTGIWVGNDDNKSMVQVTGGRLPAQIWKSFMLNALEIYPIESSPLMQDIGATPVRPAPGKSQSHKAETIEDIIQRYRK